MVLHMGKTEINSGWMKELNAKGNTSKLLGDNREDI